MRLLLLVVALSVLAVACKRDGCQVVIVKDGSGAGVVRNVCD